MKPTRLAFLWRGVGSGDSCATLNGVDVGHLLRGATMKFNVGDAPEVTLHLAANVDVGAALELMQGAGVEVTIVQDAPKRRRSLGDTIKGLCKLRYTE